MPFHNESSAQLIPSFLQRQATSFHEAASERGFSDNLIADFDPGPAKNLIGKQAAAHAYLAMDASDRQFDTLRIERRVPGKNLLIIAVNSVPSRSNKKAGTHRIN